MSIKLLGATLNQRKIKVHLPRDLLLLNFDAVLIERALCYLIENASKYSPPGAEVQSHRATHMAENQSSGGAWCLTFYVH